MKRFLVLVLTLVTTSAFAEGSGGTRGGGDVITCKKGALKGVHLADTFALKQRGAILLNTNLAENVLIESYVETLRSAQPALAVRIESQLKRLRFVPVAKVKELDDDNIEIFESKCRKSQLAIQDLGTGVVEYKEASYAALTNEEKALFKIHEAFIAEKKKPNESTTVIRAEVAAIPAEATFSNFLLGTILKHRLIPKFKWVVISDQLVHFWAITFQMSMQQVPFTQFCNQPAVYQGVLEHLHSDVPMAQTMMFDALHEALKRTTWPSYFAKSSTSRFMSAVDQSKDAVELAFALYDLSVPLWLTAQEVDLAVMNKKEEILFSICDGFSGYREEYQRDRAEYEKLLQALR